jgi:CheY-like chemotaxis protein
LPKETPLGGECNRAFTKDKRVKIILFVDDEPLILADRRSMFEGLGYSVHTAAGGAEALDLLQKHHVDAVIARKEIKL